MSCAMGLTGQYWPAHPHRLDDELLSSWFARTAYANRLKLQSFTTLTLGRGAAIWNRDIDRSAGQDVLERLSAQTGSSVDDLRSGMLIAYEGALFERHNACGNTKWILPLGIYHRTRKSYGMQFCPLCLFLDPVPYFRRRWRLASSTMCDVHGTMLHDRCPQCQAPVIYFRNDLGRRRAYRLGDLVSCWHCDFDLRRAPADGPAGPDGKSLMALRSIATFPDLGWWFQGNTTLQYGHLYFEVMHHLVMLLSSHRGSRLLDGIEKQTGWRALDGTEPLQQFPFEQRPLAERHSLLAAALWLLEDWPDRFTGVARSAGMTQSRILRGEPLPFWFDSEIRMSLGAGLVGPTAVEASHAADYLARTGKNVTRATVGSLVGSIHAAAVKSFAKQLPKEMTDADIDGVVDALQDEIAGLRSHSAARLILQRDRTIFRLIRLTRWPIRKLLDLTVADVTRIASMAPAERDVTEQVADALLWYLQDTRQHLAGEASGDALFIGWRSGGIGAKNWGLRVRRARKTTS